MERREFLSTVAVVGVAGLAGCSSIDRSNSESTSEEHRQHLEQMPWPRVRSQADGWERTDTRTQYLGQTAGMNTYQKTILQGNTAVQQNVKEKANGEFDQQLGLFFATYIDLEGLTTGLASASKIADKVAPQIKAQMEEAGIEGVDSVEPASPLPDVDGETRAFAGHYKTPAFEQTAQIEGVGKRTVRFPSKKLSIRGFATVWKEKSGVAFASGGVVPIDDYEGQSRTSITSKKSDGIDFIVDVDMNIPYERMRTEIVRMAESVEPGPSSL